MSKKKDEPNVKVAFANELCPEIYKEFIEKVISANMQEYIPPHQQKPLLEAFVKAGYMVP